MLVQPSRRTLIHAGTAGLAGLMLAPRNLLAAGPEPLPVDRGHVGDGKITFDPIQAKSEPSDQETADPSTSKKLKSLNRD